LRNAAGGILGNDFLCFYSVSDLLRTGDPLAVFDQARLFALQEAIAGQRIHFPFAYPPHLLIVLLPLAFLPYVPALYAWLAATTLPFVLLVRRASALSFVAILLMPPLVQNALSGQNGALTASLVAGALLALSGGRSFVAGLLFGCLTYKPQVFILAPLCLLACRDRRAFAGLALSGLGLPLASLAFFGADVWWRFFEHLPDQMSYVLAGRMSADRFPTVFVLAYRLGGHLAAAQAAQAISTLCAGALVYWSWRRSADVFVRALAFCVAMPLAAPYMFEYDLVLWAFPAAVLTMRLWNGEGDGADWMAALILAFLPPGIWISSLAHVNVSVFGVLVLVPYVVRAARRDGACRPNPTLRNLHPPEMVA
jgi:hypothetical protein